MRSVIVIGAGGHAKVVIATAQASGVTVSAVLDDVPATWGRTLLGLEVTGPAGPALANPDAVCVLAIGSNAVRAALARSARCAFATLVHPASTVHASVRIGVGTVVFAGAVIQPDVVLGAHVIVNTGASIDHDCVLGDAVHVAPGARLAGDVRLGVEVFLGLGAVVAPGLRVGDRTVIGAGAAVVRSLPGDVVAVGVPARVR